MPADDVPRPRHVVLVGLMATGKTRIGTQLADALGCRLLDSDAEVEAQEGRSVREIWKTDGEGAFRALEAEVLARALGAGEPAVIAAAGGVVLDPANRRALREAEGAEVVWLRARPETLHARVEASGDTHRPLLDDDPAGALRRMHDERGPLYQEVADHVVDVDGRTVEVIAAEILSLLGRGGPA